jgi:hypothetical protein
MNTIKSEIEKVEKGCGKHWEDETQEYWCGDLDYSDKPKIHYCKVCKTKLEALKFADDQHEKFIEKLKDELRLYINLNPKIRKIIDELNSEVKRC